MTVQRSEVMLVSFSSRLQYYILSEMASSVFLCLQILFASQPCVLNFSLFRPYLGFLNLWMGVHILMHYIPVCQLLFIDFQSGDDSQNSLMWNQ